LISVKGKLYGTTDLGGGGGGCPSQDGCGTFFSVTTSGKEKVLHSFGRRKDGAQPFASLIDAKGTLYGTTAAGGGSKCGGFGCGTLYSVTTTGTESVLYRFGGGSDGEYPYAALIDASGTLYGTTSRGGGSECYRHIGCGTVFAFTP
jgi:uncharacterized repeat protein (TIGR03803 family)